MPDMKYVDPYYEQQRKVLSDPDFTSEMEPACLVDNKPDEALYIDAEGDFYPCCWMGVYRYKYKSLFSPKQNKFNIADNTLDGILNRNDVKEFFESTKQFTSAHDCCKIQCTKEIGRTSSEKKMSIEKQVKNG